METFDRSAAALERQKLLLDSQLFSDITIAFNNSSAEYDMHKTILAIGSAWFLDAIKIDPDMKIIILKNEDIASIERLIRHIYGFNVFPALFPSSIFMDIKLLTTAHKFEVPTLVKQTVRSITGRLEAMKNDNTWLPTTCALVLDDIYSAPKGDGTLRQLAAEACRVHMAGLVADDMFQKTLLKFPEIATDLMKRPTVSMKAEAQESNKRRRV